MTPKDIHRIVLRAFASAFRVPQYKTLHDIWLPSPDPTHWSHNALSVIYTENAFRDPYYYDTWPRWRKAEKAIQDQLGNVYIDSYNSALWAVYHV